MKPYDNDRIFWDVDKTTLDFDLHKKYSFTRVFNRGDVQDIRNCRRFYGDEIIIDILKNIQHLDKMALSLAAAIFDTPLNDFRCYILRQSDSTLYPY